jgi:hypothetical protein
VRAWVRNVQALADTAMTVACPLTTRSDAKFRPVMSTTVDRNMMRNVPSPLTSWPGAICQHLVSLIISLLLAANRVLDARRARSWTTIGFVDALITCEHQVFRRLKPRSEMSCVCSYVVRHDCDRMTHDGWYEDVRLRFALRDELRVVTLSSFRGPPPVAGLHGAVLRSQ